MRCISLSSSQAEAEYQLYRHKDATNEESTYITKIFKQVLEKDKDLCNPAQKNLNSNVIVNGELHPRAEKMSLMAITCAGKSSNHAYTEPVGFPEGYKRSCQEPS